MAHILLRAVKDADEVVPPETALLRNTIADNAGNLIFSFAAQRILTTATTAVTADRFVIKPGDADRINERYDAYVLPLANAFRLGYEPMLVRLTALIRRLRIPVVVLGVGSQAGVDNDTERLAPIAGTVRDFVSAVLDHGPSIGVRGELTRDYLVGLGFHDVDVIGCPSLFLDGERLALRPPGGPLTAESRLAINVSPYLTRMGPIVQRHVERYPDLLYIPQDIDTLELLLWGDSVADVAPDDRRPIHLDHPLFREDKVQFFLDPPPWFAALAGRDFAFGSRIHGTIAALIAGTPAVVLAHDSRTLELARYFDIPHRLLRDVDPATLDAADLLAGADFGPLVTGHAARFARFVDFLDRHGLDHVFRSPVPMPDPAVRRGGGAWSEPVTVHSRVRPQGLDGRLKRGRRRIKRLARSPPVRRVRTALARLGGGR